MNVNHENKEYTSNKNPGKPYGTFLLAEYSQDDRTWY